MSNVARVAGQAANTLVKPLDVEDVFSTYLYEGNATARNITNGIDLDGEGGLIWSKRRSSEDWHLLFDTQRTINSALTTNATLDEFTENNSITSHLSNGYSIGTGNNVNKLNETYASWTFRKAPKFFDVVTYTGDGVAGRTVSHNLGSTPGTIIVKCLTTGFAWAVYHRSLGNTQGLNLNSTNAAFTASYYWNNTSPTSTDFTLSGNANVNGSDGDTYVAYLFAHNDGDGEFGPDGDADIIKCGSWTANQPSTVTLGFEPQWLLVKRIDGASEWLLVDNMRGADFSSYQALFANLSNAEAAQAGETFTFNPDGFTYNGSVVGGGNECIYIAIRRGPLAPPESATEVFATNDVDNGASAPDSLSGFPVDMYFRRYVNTSNDTYLLSRLTGTGAMKTNATDAEVSFSTASAGFDYNNGVMNIFSTNNTDFHTWMWRRAPNFMDCAAFTGNGSAGRTVEHGLTVPPEMMWVKNRSRGGQNWSVYHKDIGNTKTLYFREFAEITSSVFWNNTSPTDTVFTVGTDNAVNRSGDKYIAYLFASLAGISKVGSVTHSGTTNVDCGFSSGARFVLLKRTDATGGWYVWDSTRGIVSGNDPYLLLNTTAAEVTNTDLIDPLSSGFTITSSLTAGDYIFYAIA